MKRGLIRERRVRCNSCAEGRCIRTNVQRLNLKATELNFPHMSFLILSRSDPNEKQHANLLVLCDTVQRNSRQLTRKKRRKKKQLEVMLSFTPLMNVFFFLACQSFNVCREREREKKKTIKEMRGRQTTRVAATFNYEGNLYKINRMFVNVIKRALRTRLIQ